MIRGPSRTRRRYGGRRRSDVRITGRGKAYDWSRRPALGCARGNIRWGGSDRRSGHGANGDGPDILQGHRADLPGQVPGVPSAEFDRADVAHHVRGGRPWARSIKERVSHAADAALAHRPERRRPEVQERHVALADSRSTPSSRGSMPARRRAIRRTCRRAKPIAADNEWKGVQDGFGPPDLVDPQLRIQDAGARARTSGTGR